MRIGLLMRNCEEFFLNFLCQCKRFFSCSSVVDIGLEKKLESMMVVLLRLVATSLLLMSIQL